MSVENVKKFYEDIAKDEKLRVRLEKLQDEFNLPGEASDDKLISATVDIANKLGYHFSENDFKEYVSNLELSDDILEDAAGGKLSWKTFGKIVGIGLGAATAVGALAIAKDEHEERERKKMAEEVFLR